MKLYIDELDDELDDEYQKETIKVELTANIEINKLSDDEYADFVNSGELPISVINDIKTQFLSNVTGGYCWINDEQNYINI